MLTGGWKIQLMIVIKPEVVFGLVSFTQFVSFNMVNDNMLHCCRCWAVRISNSGLLWVSGPTDYTADGAWLGCIHHWCLYFKTDRGPPFVASWQKGQTCVVAKCCWCTPRYVNWMVVDPSVSGLIRSLRHGVWYNRGLGNGWRWNRKMVLQEVDSLSESRVYSRELWWLW